MKKKAMVGLIAIVAILAVATIFTGCIQKETEEVKAPTPTVSSVPTFTPTPNDNEAFINFTHTMPANLIDPISRIGDSVKEKNFKELGHQATILETLAEDYLKIIESYSISDKLLPLKSQWVEILEETKLASKHFKIGAENEDYKEIREGNRHFENIGRILDGGRPWHRVISFSGSGDKTTKTFHIKGSEWRVLYKTRSTSKYAVFTAYVYPKGKTVGSVSSWSCDEQYCDDKQYIYAGSGDYYFKVLAANLDSWELEVEDAY